MKLLIDAGAERYSCRQLWCRKNGKRRTCIPPLCPEWARRHMEDRTVEFESDDEKNRANFARHGVDFDFASLIFRAPVYEAEDAGYGYGEEHITAIGSIEDECFVVVLTRREGVIRFIGARRGGRRDRQKFAAHLAGGT